MKKFLSASAGTLITLMLTPAFALAANAFSVDDTGNVGIATDAPLAPLDVAGAMYSRLVTDTDAASSTINWNAGNVHSLTLNTSNTALSFANAYAGGEYKLILDQDSTGGRTITWPSNVFWPNGSSPTLTSAANGTDVMQFVFDGTNYLGSFDLNYQTAGTASSTLTNDLVSYWKLDGNSTDAVGSNDGSDTNVTYATSSGIINDGAGFSGTGHIVTGLSDLGSYTSGTVSTWVKFNSLSSGGIIGDWDPAFAEKVLYLVANGTDLVCMRGDSGSGAVSNYPVSNLSTGVWYNIVCEFNISGGNVTSALYVNGVDVANATSTGTANAGAKSLAIGGDDYSGWENEIDGDIDEVGVWDRLLTSAEISQLYNSGAGVQYPF